MRKLLVGALLSLWLLAIGSGVASAQTDQNTVTYSVSQVSLVDIAGNVTLNITTGVAGTGLTSATASTTYAITNNYVTTGVKITGSLNTVMPANTTLLLNLTAPGSGTSAGNVTLTATAADLVTGIGAVNTSGINMAFTLQATASAGVIASATKTLTLTLVNVA